MLLCYAFTVSSLHSTEECHLTGNSHITAACRTGGQKDLHWLGNDSSFTLEGGKTLYVIALNCSIMVYFKRLWIIAN